MPTPKIVEPSPRTDNKGPTTETPAKRSPFPWWVPIALVAAVITAVTAWLEWSRSTVALNHFHFNLDTVPLANDPGDQYAPSFSPDGREVTFTWNGVSPGSFNVYRKLVNSPHTLRLTSDTQVDYSPVWSPDGHWIAFCRGGPQLGGAVWIIPALGGAERKLVGLEAIAWPDDRILAWSLDSKRLVVSDRLAHSPDRGLSLVNVQSGATSPLTRPGAGQDDLSPAISPDGETLAFTRDIGHGVSFIEMIPFTPYGALPKQVRPMYLARL